MITVPLAIAGALISLWMLDQTLNIFSQIGIIMLIGLVTKNGILIVEFARQLHRGFENRPPLGLVEATVAACSIRIRPIIMTSLAFTFGILPLVLANSAGAKAQNAIGTGLLGGVFGATFLTILFVPVAFVAIQTLFPDKPIKGGGQNEPN
jgi:multidrug efflux pump